MRGDANEHENAAADDSKLSTSHGRCFAALLSLSNTCLLDQMQHAGPTVAAAQQFVVKNVNQSCFFETTMMLFTRTCMHVLLLFLTPQMIQYGAIVNKICPCCPYNPLTLTKLQMNLRKFRVCGRISNFPKVPKTVFSIGG